MTRTRDVDHVVVGLGGLGSAATYWLAAIGQAAARDETVVGLEQFELGHDRGASHDHSRIIRYSYHRPGYVRLAAEAYETWAAVAAEAGEELVVRTGGIDLFPAEGAIPMSDYATSLDAVGVAYEVLDADDVRRRHPQFHHTDDVVPQAQADTGIAPAARGTAAHQRLAATRGVELRAGVAVERVESDGAGELTVVTPDGAYRTGSVVMCADAWTAELLEPLGVRLPLEVTREQVAYFPLDDPTLSSFAIGRFPVWIWMDDPCFYGFPVYGDPGAVKVAEDVGGRPTTARTRTFDPDVEALERMTSFLRRVLPAVADGARADGPRVTTCLYALTPDRDFVLDTVPGHPGLQVGLGSAHGFKFASWFGRALAERAVLGATRSDIESFRIDRPALTDPTFVANYMT